MMQSNILGRYDKMSLDKDKKYTYADYSSWDTECKFELFDGIPVMQPRPDLEHQRIEGRLVQQLGNSLGEKAGDVFPEAEILLPGLDGEEPPEVKNVFVPDLIVVCDGRKLKEKYCLGAPDLVVEVVSPSTVKSDRMEKLNYYQKAGVPEYWIVSPKEENATVFVLQEKMYRIAAVYTKEDTDAVVFSIPDCKIDMSKIF